MKSCEKCRKQWNVKNFQLAMQLPKKIVRQCQVNPSQADAMTSTREIETIVLSTSAWEMSEAFATLYLEEPLKR